MDISSETTSFIISRPIISWLSDYNAKQKEVNTNSERVAQAVNPVVSWRLEALDDASVGELS
jgi:hypothetical protein